MMKTLTPVLLILAASTGHARADATLTFELTGPDGGRTTKTLAVARYFARIEDTANKDSFLLYQAGKFFPLYEVSPADKAYTRLTPDVNPTLHAGIRPTPEGEQAAGAPHPDQPAPATSPGASGEAGAVSGEEARAGTSELAAASPPSSGVPEPAQQAPESETPTPDPEPPPSLPVKPELRATRDTREVAGIECRVVDELRDGKPVLQHCMANKARLGITERETRTLARTFTMARERNLGWLGTATEDEEFVSIQVRDPESGRQLVLQALSTEPLPRGHLRIPREYEQTSR